MNYKDSQFWAILAKLRHKDQNYKCLLSYLSYGLKSNHIKNLEKKKEANETQSHTSQHQPPPANQWIFHESHAHSNISISFAL